MAGQQIDSGGEAEDLLIDTSGMNEGQREALEVAEAARDLDNSRKSFASDLFMGEADFSCVEPFPEQGEKEKDRGDEFIGRLSQYLKENLDPDEVERTRSIPEEVIAGLFEMGVFAMKVPQAYGGLGFSQVTYNRVMMLLASWCGSTAVLVSAHQSIGVPQPLKMFGTEVQKEKYFPRFRKSSISAFALTELGVGSDPAKMETIAKLSDDESHYILNGKKLWCTNGPIADVLVVMAKTAPKIVRGKERQQITAFIVEKDTPGIEMLHRCQFMGLDAIQNGLLKFTNVKVPLENVLLGEGKGLKLALATLNTGRLTLPAACTGMAKQCLSIVRRFGNQRVQWGSPIGYHEAGRSKIAYISATTFAMEAMTLLTSHYADQPEKDIRIEAAMAKLFCSEAAWKIVDQTMQLCGGKGYEKSSSLKARGEDPYPVERMLRDCRINTIIEGTSEIMRLFLAREAMDPHLRQAKDLLNRKASLVTKLKAGLNLFSFYLKWYPMRWFKGLRGSSYKGQADLQLHYHFVEKTSQKLARALFHAMGRYREKLEKRQILLAHLIDIGTELFAISATLSYASMLVHQQDNDTAVQLADLFCTHSRNRIKDHFKALHDKTVNQDNRMAQKALEGQLRWLEEGILWIGPKG